MKYKCPDCKVELTHEDERLSSSGEMYEVKVYKCYKCGAEFDEEELED